MAVSAKARKAAAAGAKKLKEALIRKAAYIIRGLIEGSRF